MRERGHVHRLRPAGRTRDRAHSTASRHPSSLLSAGIAFVLVSAIRGPWTPERLRGAVATNGGRVTLAQAADLLHDMEEAGMTAHGRATRQRISTDLVHREEPPRVDAAEADMTNPQDSSRIDDYESLFAAELSTTLSEYGAAALRAFRARMREAGFAYQPGRVAVRMAEVEAVEVVPKDIHDVLRALEATAYGMPTDSPAGCVLGAITEHHAPMTVRALRDALSGYGFHMTEAAIYTLLSRMTRDGLLERVRRGCYDLGGASRR